jgi:hypothetical protein
VKKRLASISLKKKEILLDPAVKGILRRRLSIHMTTYSARREAGDSFTKAVDAANKKERGNMSMKEWLSYNGKLGAIARWHSTKNTVRVRVRKKH